MTINFAIFICFQGPEGPDGENGPAGPNGVEVWFVLYIIFENVLEYVYEIVVKRQCVAFQTKYHLGYLGRRRCTRSKRKCWK